MCCSLYLRRNGAGRRLLHCNHSLREDCAVHVLNPHAVHRIPVSTLAAYQSQKLALTPPHGDNSPDEIGDDDALLERLVPDRFLIWLMLVDYMATSLVGTKLLRRMDDHAIKCTD